MDIQFTIVNNITYFTPVTPNAVIIIDTLLANNVNITHVNEGLFEDTIWDLTIGIRHPDGTEEELWYTRDASDIEETVYNIWGESLPTVVTPRGPSNNIMFIETSCGFSCE